MSRRLALILLLFNLAAVPIYATPQHLKGWTERLSPDGDAEALRFAFEESGDRIAVRSQLDGDGARITLSFIDAPRRAKSRTFRVDGRAIAFHGAGVFEFAVQRDANDTGALLVAVRALDLNDLMYRRTVTGGLRQLYGDFLNATVRIPNTRFKDDAEWQALTPPSIAEAKRALRLWATVNDSSQWDSTDFKIPVYATRVAVTPSQLGVYDPRTFLFDGTKYTTLHPSRVVSLNYINMSWMRGFNGRDAYHDLTPRVHVNPPLRDIILPTDADGLLEMRFGGTTGVSEEDAAAMARAVQEGTLLADFIYTPSVDNDFNLTIHVLDLQFRAPGLDHVVSLMGLRPFDEAPTVQ